MSVVGELFTFNVNIMNRDRFENIFAVRYLRVTWSMERYGA